MDSANFDNFLKQRLTGDRYEKLRFLLSKKSDELISVHRTTIIKTHPERMTKDEVLAIALLVGRSPSVLYEKYHCGWEKLTRPELQEIIKEFQEKFRAPRKEQEAA